jgi:phosphatidylserine/phosphatidylglycerophosphate/cardiolipin synthase-like enzyme
MAPGRDSGSTARWATSSPSPPPSAAHVLIVEPDDGRSAVLAALAAAKSSIALTIYELSDPQMVGALVAAQKRGVMVRVLYNWYSFSADEQQRDVTPTVQALSEAGVECRPAPKVFEVTHEKAFVLDGTSAIIQSFNLTAEYFVSTRDFGVISTIASEVNEVAAVFEADWGGQAVAPNVPTLVWSPTNSRARITSLIAAAQRTLEVYCEEISDPGTLGALVSAARRGVQVRLIAAVLTSADSPNGNARGITYLTSGGVDAVCKSFPIPGSSAPMYIHAKAIVADFGTPTAQAFVGSENLSCVSLDDNRECGILLTEPALLDRIESTFEADWAQPSVSVTPDPAPLSPCPGNAAARTQARIAGRP